MRIHIPMGITAAALAFALAACASPQPAPSVPGAESQPPTTAAPAEPVQLTLWTGFTGGDRGAYEDLIKTFNQTHTSIQVTMEIQPWDTIAQKLPAAWATGQGPDLPPPNFHPNIVAEYRRTTPLGAFHPGGTGEGQIDSAALAPATMDAFTIDGKLYAVPANIATLQLYYNKALLPEPPTTVDEFRELAKSTTADGVYGLSVGERETIQMWPILQWLDGADVVDENNCSLLDSPESIASLTTWAQLALDGAMPVGLTGGESDSVFSAGKAAMQLNGPWAAPGYLDAGIDLGIAPVPEGVDGMVTLASTVPLAISAKTQHPKEAQEFLAWWVGKDAQKQFALASGFPPVRTDLSDDPELAANDVVAKFAAALPGARLWLYGVPNAAKIDSEVYVTLIAEITRGTDVATAAKTASEKLNALSGCSK